jgi:hypothetical protein
MALQAGSAYVTVRPDQSAPPDEALTTTPVRVTSMAASI